MSLFLFLSVRFILIHVNLRLYTRATETVLKSQLWPLDQSIFPDKRMMYKEVYLLQVDTKSRLGFLTCKTVFVAGKRRELYNLCKAVS